MSLKNQGHDENHNHNVQVTFYLMCKTKYELQFVTDFRRGPYSVALLRVSDMIS